MKNAKVMALGLLLFGASFYAQEQEKPSEKPKTEKKEKEIEGVTIKKTKKAVEYKTDRDVYDFSEQTHLNNSSTMAGVQKIPGVVAGKMLGIKYKGKAMQVYMDNTPLDTGGQDVQEYLEALPAGLIEKVEFITNPGAEFPASGGGAILNIITSKKAGNYLTASLMSSYRLYTEPTLRHSTNNSINLNAKNSLFGWQLSAGQSYRENASFQSINQINTTDTQGSNKNYFIKAGLIFNIDDDKLILNGRVNQRPGHSLITTKEFPTYIPLLIDSQSKYTDFQAQSIYQMRFENDRKLDFSYTLDHGLGSYNQQLNNNNNLSFENGNTETEHSFKVDYSQPINLLDSSSLKAGGLFDRNILSTSNQKITNFNYQQQTAAGYAELESRYQDFTFALGLRSEAYQLSGDFYNNNIKQTVGFDQHRLFPNAAIDYKINDSSNMKISYNNKVELPDISLLNPNNQWLKTNSFAMTGNPNAQPTASHNYSFEYNLPFANFTYNFTDERNKNAMWFYSPTPQSVNAGFANLDRFKSHYFGLNVPIMLEMLYKSKEELKDMKPDQMNMINLYTSYSILDIPDYKSKNQWMLSVNGKFNLPYQIEFSPSYFAMFSGNSDLLNLASFQNLSFNFSRKFLDKSLTVSVFGEDIFNQMKFRLTGDYKTPYESNLVYKPYPRSFGLSLNYTFKNKNKLAKVEESILNDEKSKKPGIF